MTAVAKTQCRQDLGCCAAGTPCSTSCQLFSLAAPSAVTCVQRFVSRSLTACLAAHIVLKHETQVGLVNAFTLVLASASMTCCHFQNGTIAVHCLCQRLTLPAQSAAQVLMLLLKSWHQVRLTSVLQVPRSEMQAALALRFGGDGIVKMKGLPFKATADDVIK